MKLTPLLRTRMGSRLFAGATAAVILLGLAACDDRTAGEPAPSVSPAPEVAEEQADEPGDLRQAVLPACAELPIPAGLAESTGFPWALVPQVGPDNYHVYLNSMGPQALSTFETAAESDYCVWVRDGTHGEVWAESLVAELKPAARSDLVDGLRSSDYVESAVGDTLMFSYNLETQAAPLEIQYAFLGNVWIVAIAVAGQGVSEVVRDVSLESVTSRN